VPICALGVILPTTWAAAGGERGAVVGRLTAVNTACAAAGSIASSFVLLPMLGLFAGFALLALGHAGLSFMLLPGRWRRVRVVLPAAAALASVVLVIAFARADIGYDGRTQKRLGHWDTAYGWIDVIETRKNGQLDLQHNARYRLSSSKLAHYEVRQGHVPLLLHPQPRRVLYLGLATGVTASSALYHPQVERADVVELIPEVQQAARLFEKLNLGVVDASKMRMHVNDARHFLRQSEDDYDVIVGDLYIPWESKAGYLYTVEHFRAARAHLREGGLFCQWVHLAEVGARELALIADSMAAVFGQVTVWRLDIRANVPVLGLIGSEAPLRVEGGRLALRMDVLPRPPNGRLKRLARPRRLYELFVGQWQARRPELLNTDEHPRVEFLAPITQRRRELLKGARLERYYRDVLTQLPLAGFVIEPGPEQKPWELGEGREIQLAELVRQQERRRARRERARARRR
jgi:spermidine synthase